MWTSPEAEVCKVQAARMLRQLLGQVLELVRGHICAAHQQHSEIAGQQQGSVHCKREARLTIGQPGVTAMPRLPQLLDLVPTAFLPDMFMTMQRNCVLPEGVRGW